MEEAKKIGKDLYSKVFYIGVPGITGYCKRTNQWEGGVVVISSPFGNCQNFSLRHVHGLLRLTPKELEVIFKHIYQFYRKIEFIMDIREADLKDIQKMLKPFTKTFSIKRHKSPNGNIMVLCRAQFNIRITNC